MSAHLEEVCAWMWLGTPPRTTAQQRKHGKHGSYRTPRHKQAVATFRAVAELHAPSAPFSGPLRVEVDFYFLDPHVSEPVPKVTRPDVGNQSKDFIDALAATGYFRDDSIIYSLVDSKWRAPWEGIRLKIQRWVDE